MKKQNESLENSYSVHYHNNIFSKQQQQNKSTINNFQNFKIPLGNNLQTYEPFDQDELQNPSKPNYTEFRKENDQGKTIQKLMRNNDEKDAKIKALEMDNARLKQLVRKLTA